MGKTWEFFENLNEFVYVTDMDSHELVYMNKKTLETYGFHSLSEITGKKCYEVLQNSSTPCTICNNQELQEGYFKEWRYYNPILASGFKGYDDSRKWKAVPDRDCIGCRRPGMAEQYDPQLSKS